MAKVWVDVSSLIGAGPVGHTTPAQVECVRLALASEPGHFAFSCLDGADGFRSVDPAELQAALERVGTTLPIAAAPLPADPGLRERAKTMIGRLPASLQAPAMAFGRAGSRMLRGGDAADVAQPAPFVAPEVLRAPFAADDVYLSFASSMQADRRVVEGSRQKPRVYVLAADEERDTPAQIIRRALVTAYGGGSGFEERLQHLYTSVLQPGESCIDIGAHMGRHSLPMSLAVGANGRVDAFEPSPAIAQRLRTRLRLLSAANITVHETALSDEAGSAEFVIAVDLPEESGLKQRTTYNGPTRTEKVKVQLAPLDSLDFAHPRFIKLDTEGAEYKVLLGARRTIERCRPVVAFEFGQASYSAYDVNPDDVFDYFESLGYDVFSILGERLGKAAFAQASRLQHYWDYVACDRAIAPRVASVLQAFGKSGG